MSTRSLVAVKQDDGTVKSIYTHFDGYPDHNGRLLLENYNSRELANALLELGSLSVLTERLAPEPGEKHSYDEALPDVCVAYHRDRGEEYQPPTTWNSPKQIIAEASDRTRADYVYLFTAHGMSIRLTARKAGLSLPMCWPRRKRCDVP